MFVRTIFLIVLLGYGHGVTNFGRTLEFIIPSGREVMPTKFTTSLRGLLLPDFSKTISPINKTLISLEKILTDGTLFDEAKKQNLYPLYDLRTSILNSKIVIDKNLNDFEQLLTPSRVGQRVDSATNHLFTKDQIFPELSFAENAQSLSSLRKYKDIPLVTGTGDVMQDIPSIRNSENFAKALHFSTILNQDLKLFAEKFRLFVDTLSHLKRGDIKSLTTEFFFKDNIERILDTHIKVLNVDFFDKTDVQFEVILTLAEYGGVSEFVSYFNVQYYGQKLKDSYYSKVGENELFELTCFAHNLCVPTSTICSRALFNETAYEILSKCSFIKSDLEFEIVNGVGLLINMDPENQKIVSFLNEQKISPTSFPLLVEFSGCLSFDDEVQVCFHKDKCVIYSRFKDELFSFINPLWYVVLVENFNNVPLLIYVLFWILTFFLIFFGSYRFRKALKKFLKDRKDRKERKEQMQNPSAPLDSDREQEPEQDRTSSKERRRKSKHSHKSKRSEKTYVFPS